MEFNKTETKFLVALLNKEIAASERYTSNSLGSYLNPEFPNYTIDVYQKNKKKNDAVISRCEKILDKLI